MSCKTNIIAHVGQYLAVNVDKILVVSDTKLRRHELYSGPLKRLSPGANAFCFAFDEAALDELRAEYQQRVAPVLADPEKAFLLDGKAAYSQPFSPEYYAVSFGLNPLLWVSCNHQRTYEVFQRFYNRLGVDQELLRLIDHRDHSVLSCGFFVIGNRAPQPVWHVDYEPDANCYSVLTPLFELTPQQGHLWYRSEQDEIETYAYKLGEAVAFGDHFWHATEPYEAPGSMRVVISMQVSTDKMEHWPQLKKTIATQSFFLMLPCGHRLGSCKCHLMTPAASAP